MKKTIFLASLLIAFNFTNAQESKTSSTKPAKTTEERAAKKENKQLSPEQKSENFLMKLSEAVTLEEKQKSKVKSLALDHFNAVAAARKALKGDKEKMRAEAKKSKAIFNEGLNKVLTPTQLEAWKAKRKENVQKNKGKQSTEPAEDSLMD
jgi:hypothetical protein